MNARQISKYWAVWRNVCLSQGWDSRNSDLDQKRHACHLQALTYDKSHKDFSNREFDRVLNLFDGLIEPESLPARMEECDYEDQRKAPRQTPIKGKVTKYHLLPTGPDPGERRRLHHVINRFRQEIGQEYVDSILEDMCGTPVLDEIEIQSLTLVRDTLVIRKRQIAKRKAIEAAKSIF